MARNMYRRSTDTVSNDSSTLTVAWTRAWQKAPTRGSGQGNERDIAAHARCRRDVICCLLVLTLTHCQKTESVVTEQLYPNHSGVEESLTYQEKIKQAIEQK